MFIIHNNRVFFFINGIIDSDTKAYLGTPFISHTRVVRLTKIISKFDKTYLGIFCLPAYQFMLNVSSNSLFMYCKFQKRLEQILSVVCLKNEM